jgi:hypothetical protein
MQKNISTQDVEIDEDVISKAVLPMVMAKMICRPSCWHDMGTLTAAAEVISCMIGIVSICAFCNLMFLVWLSKH